MKGIFFATSTGNTEEVANKIHERLDDFEIVDISKDGVNKINECSIAIIGTPTWGDGELQDDWEDCFEEFKQIDFSTKTVALFGLGDQESYGDEFVNAMGTMYEVVSEKGANVIGFTSTQSYDFEESTAVLNDEFVGLVIDEDNQCELTDERINSWCESISNFIK